MVLVFLIELYIVFIYFNSSSSSASSYMMKMTYVALEYLILFQLSFILAEIQYIFNEMSLVNYNTQQPPVLNPHV